MAELNATQGSLLGFLHDGPKTGWDLLQEVDQTLARFWNITPSHVYRELRTLERRRLIRSGEPEARDRRPFAITPAGRRAFSRWIEQAPGPEQIRFPLLVTLWFSRHLESAMLHELLASNRADHEARLARYREAEQSLPAGDGRTAVVRFGIAYEQAVLAWLHDTRRSLDDHRAAARSPGTERRASRSG